MLGFAAPWANAFPPFAVACVACLVLVPASRRLAVRVGAVDHPEVDRRIHTEPTPRLGGIALFAGFAAAVALFGGPVSDRWQIVAVTGAVTLAMAVDDLLHLPWWTKLVIEVGVGVLTAALGIAISFLTLPGHDVHVVQLGWLAVPATAAWVVGMQTSINLLDGSDGVAAGVVAIVAGICLVAAINRLDDPGGIQNGVIVLSGALMGCCAGFLVFNFPPASVFMGDAGSHFLGVALAIITILGVAKVAVALSLFIPLIALALPIGDTAFAIVRRRRAGRSMAEADTDHLHHRLLAWGMSPLETALTFYLGTAVFGCFSLAIFGHRRIVLVGLVLFALALGGMLLRHRRNRRRRGRAELDPDGFVVIPGRPATPARMRHRGEID